MKRITLLLLLIVCSFSSCKKDDGNTDNNSDGITDPIEVALLLNENLIMPANSYTIDPDNVSIDNSIVVSSAAGDIMPIHTGRDLGNTIIFSGPNPVSAIGMRFGPTGPIMFVPVSEIDMTNGISSFIFSINPEICEDIAQICHDIKCYEFAMTEAGAISQADLQDIALICGACDEPSCLDLLDEEVCNSNGMEGGDGNPRFNLTWSGSSSTDLDLHVEDPTGEIIYFGNQSSSSGGVLDVDCQGNCGSVNTENIFWENGGPSGTYTYHVNYWSGSDPTPFTISVSSNGNVINTVSGSLSMPGQDSPSWTYVKN